MKHGLSRGWLVFVLVAATPVAVAAPTGPKKPTAAKKAPAARKPPPPKPAAKAKLTLSPKEVKPGDPVLITVTGVDDRPKGTAGHASLVFFPVRGGWQAVFATPLEEAPEAIDVKVDRELTGSVRIKPTEFPLEAGIKVPPEYAAPPPDKRKLVDEDNRLVIAAVKNDDPPMFKGPFRRPGPGRPTSPYGSVRTFNEDPYKSRHLGQDVAARLGAPVRSVQRGKVTLVRDGFLMGGIVVISHGAGIASIYLHLGDPKVKVGDEVTAGQIIGKVSLSGRTTGPHIHLGIWVPNGFVNPAAFYRLKLKPVRELTAKK